MIGQFNSFPCNLVLINDIGYSSPNSPFWVSTDASEFSEAKVYRMKSFSKSKLLKEGAWAIAVLMSLKVTFSISVHLNYTLCLTIFYKGFTICAKYGTNLRTKFIVSMNDCIDFLSWGKEIYDITSTLSGSIEIPFFEMMWPYNFPSKTTNILFFGFKDMPYFLQWSKICFKWKTWSSHFLNKVVTSSK